jgi:hypothetical protein
MDKLQPERSLEKISKGALKEAIKNTKKSFGQMKPHPGF